NYDDNGRWFVMLDEAHKGDKEESKRQHIYAILARNGFLFNFSATFTDPRDIITTVSNFNLPEFIKAGYGKHICILEQTFRAFRDDEDYSGDEKQRIVLKSLLLLAYVAKFAQSVQAVRADMYHRPLLLTLVNSVNVEDADLKLFFRELARIGRGNVENTVWQRAWAELRQELTARPRVLFEDESIVFNENIFSSLRPKDILQLVFNAQAGGEIEVLQHQANRKELAFKLRTSDRPFALVKIGDVSAWIKEELAGYEVSQRFEDESYFEQLNRPNSSINILMGSRSFYEGWDSNRPNVINYINIGTGTDARKFILQSVGRGVRIEPVQGQRQRLQFLHRNGIVDDRTSEAVRDKAPALETLLILGTNRQALQTVISEIKKEGGVGERHQLSLFLNPAAKRQLLLVPTYRRASAPLAEQRRIAKYDIDREELKLLKQYAGTTDSRVLLARHSVELRIVRLLQKSLANPDDFYSLEGQRVRNLDVLTRRVFSHLVIVPEELDRLKPMSDEIRHYQSIVVELKDITELTEKVERVRDYRDPAAEERELDTLLDQKKITRDEYKERLKAAARRQPRAEFIHNGRKLNIEFIANHYYVPVLLTEDEEVEYVKHVIRHESEVRFVRTLQQHLDEFNHFDWWMFTKVDESLDSISIPSYDVTPHKFFPDFVFWLQKGNRYIIAFVDPKGTEHTQFMRKIDGYRMLFEENGKPKVIKHNGLDVYVVIFIYPRDRTSVPADYKKYAVDSITGLIRELMKLLPDPL
ncbi:MAG: restriction endonuclease subunit R, partial [candidate division WOR-3 bacterium]